MSVKVKEKDSKSVPQTFLTGKPCDIVKWRLPADGSKPRYIHAGWELACVGLGSVVARPSLPFTTLLAAFEES